VEKLVSLVLLEQQTEPPERLEPKVLPARLVFKVSRV
jgi:hypothetical protein